MKEKETPASRYVIINLPVYERQLEDEREARRRWRELDPCRLGLYGPLDEEEAMKGEWNETE
jgi:hypothetical protein